MNIYLGCIDTLKREMKQPSYMYLFKSNNKASLLDAFIKFENMDKKVINKKTLDCKKAIKNFSYFSHFKSLEKIL